MSPKLSDIGFRIFTTSDFLFRLLSQLLLLILEGGCSIGNLLRNNSMHPSVKPDGANIAGGGLILRQDVDFTKLLLKLLDSLNAIRVCFADALGRHGRPALVAWYDRNRD